MVYSIDFAFLGFLLRNIVLSANLFCSFNVFCYLILFYWVEILAYLQIGNLQLGNKIHLLIVQTVVSFPFVSS